jgi:hypothetical protein
VLITVLLSEHEGGGINLYHSGSSTSFVTAVNFTNEYQYLAVRSGTMISSDVITSGAHLALIHGLRSDASPDTEINRDHHPNAPEMRKLKDALSV